MQRLLGIVLVWGLASGCYVLQPVAGHPLPLGAQIGVDVSDAGRIALGGSMGPEISQIEGRLVQKDSAEYVIAVSMIHLLRGGEQIWTGERIRIKSEYVTRVYERKLSKGRTAAITAAGLGIVAYIASQSLKGGLFGDEGKLPPDTALSIRYRRP